MKNKNAGTHPSYDKRKMSAKQVANKKKYDSEYQKKTVKYRVELNKKNRENHKAGKSKVGDKVDVSHTKKGKLTLEKQKTNRQRQGANGKSTKK